MDFCVVLVKPSTVQSQSSILVKETLSLLLSYYLSAPNTSFHTISMMLGLGLCEHLVSCCLLGSDHRGHWMAGRGRCGLFLSVCNLLASCSCGWPSPASSLQQLHFLPVAAAGWIQLAVFLEAQFQPASSSGPGPSPLPLTWAQRLHNTNHVVPSLRGLGTRPSASLLRAQRPQHQTLSWRWEFSPTGPLRQASELQ